MNNARTSKPFTYSDGQAIIVLVGESLNLKVSSVGTARAVLNGETVHPSILSRMDKDATQVHNHLSGDAEAVSKANKLATELKRQFGFIQ